MDAQATEEILRFFRGIPDRRAANARHGLSDVLSIQRNGRTIVSPIAHRTR